jgi:hypothetical protein
MAALARRALQRRQAVHGQLQLFTTMDPLAMATHSLVVKAYADIGADPEDLRSGLHVNGSVFIAMEHAELCRLSGLFGNREHLLAR